MSAPLFALLLTACNPGTVSTDGDEGNTGEEPEGGWRAGDNEKAGGEEQEALDGHFPFAEDGEEFTNDGTLHDGGEEADEGEGHKAIVIGKGGESLKRIASEARQDMERGSSG